MKLLVTGFEPFGGESVNPSWEAALALPDRMGAAEVVRRRLPVVFGECGDAVAAAMREERPDAVVCLGQAGGRSQLTPEFVGIDWRAARIPDNAGVQPEGERILPDGPDAYFSTLPVGAMAAACVGAGVPAAVSYTAGTFCCNEVLYRALRTAEQELPGCRCCFVHVPYLPEQVAASGKAQPSMPLATIVRGLTAMLDGTLAPGETVPFSD